MAVLLGERDAETTFIIPMHNDGNFEILLKHHSIAINEQ